MNPPIRTFSTGALGNNLHHLHLLRKLALLNPKREFLHYCPDVFHWQLDPAIADTPNLKLARAYKLAEKHALDMDAPHRTTTTGGWADDRLKVCATLCEFMELPCPLREPRDLLFDYPALKRPTALSAPFDFLIVNSRPTRGQFLGFTEPDYFDPLIERLMGRYRVIVTGRTRLPVPCTLDYSLSVTQIGNLSLTCPYLVMASSGPSWPTFNVFNLESVQLRVLLRDDGITVDHAPRTVQVRTLAQAIEALKERKLVS